MKLKIPTKYGIIVGNILGVNKYEIFRVLYKNIANQFDEFDLMVEIISTKMKVPVKNKEVYFQDHPQGYNQPCFKK